MNREQFLMWAAGVYQGAKSTVRQVPADKIDHRPADNMLSIGQLIRHMGSSCGAALKMVAEMDAQPPDGKMQVPGVEEYKPYETVQEALDHLERDEATLREVVMAVSEEDFQNKMIQLPWAPMQVPYWMLALMMADHLSIHRTQLHQNLKALGLPVDTHTLYGMG